MQLFSPTVKKNQLCCNVDLYETAKWKITLIAGETIFFLKKDTSNFKKVVQKQKSSYSVQFCLTPLQYFINHTRHLF